MEAGHKRAQPIVMTTVAMTAGMIPAAISLSGDSAFRAPMGTVVIGGCAFPRADAADRARRLQPGRRV
jgi:multidrug efflux pump subunit AcrB